MNYQLTEPISAYPDGYREDPLFGDPSLELDQGWSDRLRCRNGLGGHTVYVLMLIVFKMPTSAYLPRSSPTTIKAASFLGTDQGILLPQQSTMTCTAQGFSIKPSILIIIFPTI